MKLTTKFKKNVKTNNNIEMQDKCLSGQGERGGGGRKYVQKNSITLPSRHGFHMGPITYTIDIIIVMHIYCISARLKVFQFGVLFLIINLLPTAVI